MSNESPVYVLVTRLWCGQSKQFVIFSVAVGMITLSDKLCPTDYRWVGTIAKEIVAAMTGYCDTHSPLL